MLAFYYMIVLTSTINIEPNELIVQENNIQSISITKKRIAFFSVTGSISLFSIAVVIYYRFIKKETIDFLKYKTANSKNKNQEKIKISFLEQEINCEKKNELIKNKQMQFHMCMWASMLNNAHVSSFSRIDKEGLWIFVSNEVFEISINNSKLTESAQNYVSIKKQIVTIISDEVKNLVEENNYIFVLDQNSLDLNKM